MADRSLTELEVLAVLVSACAPKRPPSEDVLASRKATIPWPVIIQIREAIELAGLEAAEKAARLKLAG